MKFLTKSVHVGQEADQETGAVIPPIYQTSTYAQESPGKHRGYDYTRAGNPNFTNLEQAIASLEGGKYGTVFSSGLGATTALMMQLKSGDHVVAVDDVYGGTYRLLSRLSAQFGIKVTYVDGDKALSWQKAIQSTTRYCWIESPTNPLLKTVNIETLCNLTRKNGVTSVVDNTFASPYFQRPLESGADVVLHSMTKYIGGHSDIVGGAIVTNDRDLSEKLWFARMAFGLNPSPFDVWLTHRGLKTLGLRMEQHGRGAKKVAEFLAHHRRVKKAYYPGFGGMVSADFNMPAEKLKSLLGTFRLFALAESLGGVESLVCHPATMTHLSVPAEIRRKRGITDTLIRFSVGIENPEDLIHDLQVTLEGK